MAVVGDLNKFEVATPVPALVDVPAYTEPSEEKENTLPTTRPCGVTVVTGLYSTPPVIGVSVKRDVGAAPVVRSKLSAQLSMSMLLDAMMGLMTASPVSVPDENDAYARAAQAAADAPK